MFDLSFPIRILYRLWPTWESVVNLERHNPTRLIVGAGPFSRRADGNNGLFTIEVLKSIGEMYSKSVA